jgi:hypothetical protein
LPVLPPAFLVMTYLSPVDVLLLSLQGIKIFHFVFGHLYISRRTFFLLCSSELVFAFDFQIPRIIVESFTALNCCFSFSDNGYFINVIVLLNQIYDIHSFIDYVKIVCLPSSQV